MAIIDYIILKEQTINFNATKFIELKYKTVTFKNIKSNIVSIARGTYAGNKKIYHKNTLNIPDNKFLLSDIISFLQKVYKEVTPFENYGERPRTYTETATNESCT